MDSALAAMVDRGNLETVLELLRAERAAHEQRKLDGRWTHTCADREMDANEKLVVLGEEFGEVCRALLERQGDERLRAELMQVAAVATAWAQSITPSADTPAAPAADSV